MDGKWRESACVCVFVWIPVCINWRWWPKDKEVYYCGHPLPFIILLRREVCYVTTTTVHKYRYSTQMWIVCLSAELPKVYRACSNVMNTCALSMYVEVLFCIYYRVILGPFFCSFKKGGWMNQKRGQFQKGAIANPLHTLAWSALDDFSKMRYHVDFLMRWVQFSLSLVLFQASLFYLQHIVAQ